MKIIKKIFYDFFYSFMPKILKGSRDKDVYSSMRVMMVGCFTAAIALSICAIIFFILYKQSAYIYALVAIWLMCAVALSILIKMRDKDRVNIAGKVINAAENILTHDKNNN